MTEKNQAYIHIFNSVINIIENKSFSVRAVKTKSKPKNLNLNIIFSWHLFSYYPRYNHLHKSNSVRRGPTY